MIRYSIVFPCFNEAKSLKKLLEKLDSSIRQKDIEVILVNNGSTDDTQEILDSILPHFPFAKSIKIETNIGYGFGILSGLDVASGQILAYSHADLQTDPNDLIKAFNLFESSGKKDIFVKGNRKNRPFSESFFTIGMSIFESVLLREKLWDINAQPNVFSKSFYESIRQNAPHDFSLDLYLLYKARTQRLEILRFSVIFPPREYGVSSWNTGLKAKYKFIKRTINFSLKLKKEIKNAIYRS